MVKKLQKKFVFTAMLAVTVLLLMMLGAINAANIVSVGKDIDRKLDIISENALNPFGGIDFPESFRVMRGDAPEKNGKNEYDTVMSSTFFTVAIDENGEITDIDLSRISSLDEESAKELAEKAVESGKESGKTGKYRYNVRIRREDGEKIIIFLDASDENRSYIRVLLISCAIGIICWGLMLIFVILLSKKAINPIAENIEKQRRFVTDAGHEIKTPLAIIRANTEALELYSGESKYSKNIKEQTGRLGGLMDNLLLLAKAEEGAWASDASDFSLSDTLLGAADSFSQPFEMKNISVEKDISPDIRLHADKSRTEQLISVLLDNAAKYTNDGGHIKISLKKDDKKIKMTVRNTCEELPKAPPEKLFDRFYRADGARTQKSGGYGIGLSSAKAISRLLGAQIKADYPKENTVEFTVIF